MNSRSLFSKAHSLYSLVLSLLSLLSFLSSLSILTTDITIYGQCLSPICCLYLSYPNLQSLSDHCYLSSVFSPSIDFLYLSYPRLQSLSNHCYFLLVFTSIPVSPQFSISVNSPPFIASVCPCLLPLPVSSPSSISVKSLLFLASFYPHLLPLPALAPSSISVKSAPFIASVYPRLLPFTLVSDWGIISCKIQKIERARLLWSAPRLPPQ